MVGTWEWVMPIANGLLLVCRWPILPGQSGWNGPWIDNPCHAIQCILLLLFPMGTILILNGQMDQCMKLYIFLLKKASYKPRWMGIILGSQINEGLLYKMCVSERFLSTGTASWATHWIFTLICQRYAVFWNLLFRLFRPRPSQLTWCPLVPFFRWEFYIGAFRYRVGLYIRDFEIPEIWICNLGSGFRNHLLFSII